MPAALPIDDDPGACSVPRGGGWRPGAKWARAQVDAQIAALPKHRRPAARELGRHSEAAAHAFKSQVRRADQTFAGAITSHRQPLVLSEPVGRALLAAAVCPDAAALGLSNGMAIAHARALVSDLDIRAHDRAADELSLRRLALHAATHWTPIAAASSDGLLLDLTGTAHLHGGEARFCRRVVRFLKRLGFTGRIAVADTVGTAHAVARYSGLAMAIVPVGQGAQSIAALPVAALRLEERAIDAAKRFGLDRVGDLLGLPRAPLARRLGRPAIERLDQALGRIAEPIDPVLPRDPVVVERRLLEPIATVEAILQ
ncbi:Y-family DNA polymerase, partial [Sphingomonas aestuarii]